MLGSVTNPDPRIRRKAIDHLLDCVDVMDATGSRDLKLWFSDGTNYPGQDSIRDRQDRLADALAEVYARLGDDQRLILEYKLFEPAFYTHGRPGLGHVVRALPATRRPGEGVRRHRPSRARHQHRVHRGVPAAGREARRLRLQLPVLRRRRPDGRGGRPVPAVPDPVRDAPSAGALEPGNDIAYMLDQCHNIEPKIPGQIRSVMNVQEATAKALLVDPDALAAAQRRRGRAGRQRGPDGRLQHRRPRRCWPRSGPDAGPATRIPMAAYARPGTPQKIVADRVGGDAGRVGSVSAGPSSMN